MRKIVALLTLLLLLTISCVMEPPTTFYLFKIINKSKVLLLIDYNTVKYKDVGRDILKPEQEFVRDIPDLGCFKNYHDTLIQSFFKELKVQGVDQKLNINLYNRSIWKDSTDLRGSWNCKGGTVYYTLVIKDSDLE